MNVEKIISDWLHSLNINETLLEYIIILIQVVFLTILGVVTDFITKKVFLQTIRKVISRSKSNWDDLIYQRKVFHKLAHIVPALIILFLSTQFFKEYVVFLNILSKGILIFIIYIGIRSVTAFMNGLHDIYLTLPISKDRPIKSYIQIVIIVIYFIGIILILSILFDKKITTFFAGLGALAAVLMLVFKDTILGLVGGIQLSANDMVRPGDWIEMPSRKADGDVIDISLHTVKVQNWDKTITTIPTYALVNESFVNWRGMEQSGGRRIKRAIKINMSSIKYCDDQMIEKFKKIKILRPYIEHKENELKEYNRKHDIDDSVLVNGRRMTNFGTFRKYVELYLKNHPQISQDMTFLVRHLKPDETGIPLEIYVFSKDKVWANYEAIQADIFDHILAAIHEFDLAVFQNPTGSDFKALKG